MNAPIDFPAASEPVVRIAPAEALTIYTVDALARAWAAAMPAGGMVEIDLGAIAACDSLGVQLLCAAKRTADAGGLTLRFARVSAAVERAAAAIACEGLLVASPLSS